MDCSSFSRNLNFLQQHKERNGERIDSIRELMKEMTKLVVSVEKEKKSFKTRELQGEDEETPQFINELKVSCKEDTDDLDSTFRQLIKLKEEVQIRSNILDELKNGRVSIASTSVDEYSKLYRSRLKSELKKLQDKMTQPNEYFYKNDGYKNHVKAYYRINNDKEPYPWEDVDSDISILEQGVNVNCPILGEVMRDPYKAPCGHHMSKQGVEQLLNQTRSTSINCPVVGCNVRISLNVLERDLEFKDKILEELKKKENTVEQTQTLEID